MYYKIKLRFTILKLFYKKLIFIILSLIIFFGTYPIHAKELTRDLTHIKIESNLALKYCKSIDERLFEGLDNEKILKYQYFFSSISNESISNFNEFIKDFKLQVYSICSYELTKSNEEEFYYYLKKFYSEK